MMNEETEVQQNLLKSQAEQPVFVRRKNWPICLPLLYHDIDADIKEPAAKNVVRYAYFGWFGFYVAVIMNCIGETAVMIDNASLDTILDFILSLVYIIALPAGAFFTYRFLYNGAREIKSVSIYVFFCLFAVQVMIEIFLAIGLEKFGGAGFVSMIDMFEKSHLIAALLVMGGTILWVLIIVYDIWIFYRVRLLLNNLGGVQQAKQEVVAAAAATVYENKEVIAQTAYENRATIGSVIKQQVTATAVPEDPYAAQPQYGTVPMPPPRSGPMPGRANQAGDVPPWNQNEGDAIFSGRNV